MEGDQGLQLNFALEGQALHLGKKLRNFSDFLIVGQFVLRPYP